MTRFVLIIVSVLLTATLHAQTSRIAAPKPHTDWVLLHQKIVSTVRETNPSVIFLGDSITYEWMTKGKAIWDERYAPLKAVNMGIPGDQTQNVLWRLENGGFAGVEPKVVVLLIGTNNTNDDPPSDVAAGVAAIVQKIRQIAPSSKILLLGVLPRQKEPGPRREMIAAVNEMIAPLDDEKNVFYLDIGKNFLQADDTISGEIMPDGLHLSATGYEIWADAMAGKLAQLLNETDQAEEEAKNERN